MRARTSSGLRPAVAGPIRTALWLLVSMMPSLPSDTGALAGAQEGQAQDDDGGDQSRTTTASPGPGSQAQPPSTAVQQQQQGDQGNNNYHFSLTSADNSGRTTPTSSGADRERGLTRAPTRATDVNGGRTEQGDLSAQEMERRRRQFANTEVVVAEAKTALDASCRSQARWSNGGERIW